MIKKKEMVMKSNRIVEASYRLTLVEQQVILYAICRAREEQKGLDSNDPITIRAIDFAAQFGTNPTVVYDQLKLALKTISKRTVSMDDMYKAEVRNNDVPWLCLASYVKGAGIVQLRFNPIIVPYITRLETSFTTYRLEKIGKMSSAHAIRLYELLFQYLNAGKRNIEIIWLKNILQLNDEYKSIYELKRRVIDVAVKQINEFSDIKVKYEQKKLGRVVTHLYFTIKLKVSEKSQSKKANADSSKPTHASHIETPTPKKSTRSAMPDGLADNLKRMLKPLGS